MDGIYSGALYGDFSEDFRRILGHIAHIKWLGIIQELYMGIFLEIFGGF